MKGLLWVVFITASVFLIYMMFVLWLNGKHRYQPAFEERELIYRGASASYTLPTLEDTFSLVSWNIGYAGLGKENTFFYDGGKQVKPTKVQYEKNLSGIVKTLQSLDSVHFLLLQEVDFDASRTLHVNQQHVMMNVLPFYWTIPAVNYDAYFVPVPFFHPMGKVKSGLLTLARFFPFENTRIAFPMLENWPKSLFMLQRCFSFHRFYVGHSKYLYVVNLHLSAFDEGATSRWTELVVLRSYILHWYNQGHYVVVGGDWNTNPPDFKASYAPEYKFKSVGKVVSVDFLPEGWQWIYDPSYPTNRFVQTPYQKGITPTTTIDYFLVSPNIKVLDMHALHEEFEFSDHNPVYLKFCLKTYESSDTASF